MEDTQTLPHTALSDSHWMVNLDRLMAGALAGAVCGALMLGGGSRAAMRVVALVLGQPPAFTLAGTFGILLMGVIAGALFGFVFAPLARGIALGQPWRGASYGALLTLIFVAPLFLFNPDGELALLPAWAGIALFGALPILYGMALDAFLRRLTPKLDDGRTVHILWLLAFTIVLMAAFAGLAGIANASVRAPVLIHALFSRGAVPFHQTLDTLRLLGLFFALLYCTLCAVAFWRGCDRVTCRIAVMLLLVAALGVLAPVGPTNPLSALFALLGAQAADGVARLLGLAMLVAVPVILPNWRWASAREWSAALLTWLAISTAITLHPTGILMWMCWLGTTGGLCVIVLAKASARRKISSNQLRCTLDWSMIAAIAFLLVLPGAWLMIAMTPTLALPQVSSLSTLFMVTVFWYFWLVLPPLVLLSTTTAKVPYFVRP
ncbi:MAG: hypothetical protein R6W76_17490 [Caldilinea sp.]